MLRWLRWLAGSSAFLALSAAKDSGQGGGGAFRLKAYSSQRSTWLKPSQAEPKSGPASLQQEKVLPMVSKGDFKEQHDIRLKWRLQLASMCVGFGDVAHRGQRQRRHFDGHLVQLGGCNSAASRCSRRGLRRVSRGALHTAWPARPPCSNFEEKNNKRGVGFGERRAPQRRVSALFLHKSYASRSSSSLILKIVSLTAKQADDACDPVVARPGKEGGQEPQAAVPRSELSSPETGHGIDVERDLA